MGISSVLRKLTIKEAMANPLAEEIVAAVEDVRNQDDINKKILAATRITVKRSMDMTMKSIFHWGEEKDEDLNPIKQEELKIEELGAVFSKEIERLKKMFLKNNSLFLGTFALAMYISRLNGDAEAELEKIHLCLEHDTILQKDLKLKMQEIYQAELDFSTIKENYLDAVSFRELHCMDSIIREIAIRNGNISGAEKDFLKESWIPYFIDRIGEE